MLKSYQGYHGERGYKHNHFGHVRKPRCPVASAIVIWRLMAMRVRVTVGVGMTMRALTIIVMLVSYFLRNAGCGFFGYRFLELVRRHVFLNLHSGTILGKKVGARKIECLLDWGYFFRNFFSK